ncbi:unnamed protein product [Allacma fusca]|uniref:Uncharacterized protein n=1 Tax=Allacma fusca TaxID=39272 RepID=A0A8J2PYJ6_9HEXA|nr:unnamed protein product [Allacma fusca]
MFSPLSLSPESKTAFITLWIRKAMFTCSRVYTLLICPSLLQMLKSTEEFTCSQLKLLQKKWKSQKGAG